jgi:hypothetical protein
MTIAIISINLYGQGKKSLGRPRRRGEDNSKTYIQEEGWDMDWIDLV